MSLPSRPARGRIALLAFAVALLAHAPAALAVPPSAEQVPLELRPGQGPAGSETIVQAAGWTPSENVRIYVDGEHVATEQVGGSGVAARIVEAPAAVGVHRLVLYGETSQRTAAGTFRTTATGAARTAFVATPRPMAASGVASHPYLVRYLVVNFPAGKQIEGYYYWEPSNVYFEPELGDADANGTFEALDTWAETDFGVTGLAIGEPLDDDPLLAADALIVPKPTYTAARRVRAVPSLGRPDEPIFLVGSGFTAGEAVTRRELEGPGVIVETAAGTAAADGTVVARDDAGNFDQQYQLAQSGGYGAAAAYREGDSVTPPTAAAAPDLLDPGATTTVVAVGLTPGPVTLTGRDAAGATSTKSATAAADGTVQTTFTVPAGSEPGAYEIDVGGASATLSVKGAIAPPRFGNAGPGTVVLPPGGGDVTRQVSVCNDRGAAATVALADDSAHVTLPASVSVPAGGCEQVTVTIGDEGPAGTSTVTLAASAGWTGDELTFQRVLRSVSIDAVQTRAMDAAGGVHHADPLVLTGDTDPGAQIRVLALPYGDPAFDLGTANADGAGEWELQPFSFPPRGSHLRFVAVPAELSATGDHSAYDVAAGAIFASRYGTPTDLSTSTSVFRGVGDAAAGVEDVFVLAPDTSDDSFDGAAALEVAEGGAAQTLATTEESAANPGGVLTADRWHDVGSTGVELRRRLEAGPDARSMLVTDTFTNPTGQARTFDLALVTADGRAPDDQELRLSTGSEWLGDGEVPAEGLTLAEGGAVPAQGYVALRDEDAADAAASGHGLVAWRQAPARVRTRPGRRDLLVLEHQVTVPAGGTRELVHAIGATPTDATALATAAAAADTVAPALAVTAPAGGATVGTRQVTVSGTVSDALGTPTVDVDGVVAPVASNGTWSADVVLSDGDGQKTITVTAADGHGNTATVERVVVLSRPPIVATGDASAITQTGASISASVNPNGNSTTYAVEYGTTSALGSTTAASSPVGGTTAVTHGVELTGLSPATTYHYRVTATNSAGTRTGETRTFDTLAPPDAATSSALAASERTATAALLSGTVNPNGSETTWRIEYGPTTDLGSFTPASASIGAGTAAVPVSRTLDGLAPNTTYHARLVATNDAGAAPGPTTTFSTLPTAGALSASAIAHDAVRLTGGVQAHSWVLQYGTTTAYGQTIAGTGASVDETIGGLAPATTYHARLVATGPGGTVEGPDVAFATLPLPEASALDASVGTTSATLSGSVIPYGDGEWWVEHGPLGDPGPDATAAVPVSGDEPVAAGVVLDGLMPSTGYQARLAVRRGTAVVRGPWRAFTTSAPPPDPDPDPDPDPPAPPDPEPPGPPGPPDPLEPGPKVCGDCGVPPRAGPPIPFPTLPADLRPRTIAARGLALAFDLLTADCSPGCALRIEVLRGRSVVGTVTRTYTKPGLARALVRLKPRARRALRRARRATLTVRVTLVDGEGRTATALRRVALRR